MLIHESKLCLVVGIYLDQQQGLEIEKGLFKIPEKEHSLKTTHYIVC